jgi:hypothetical protein
MSDRHRVVYKTPLHRFFEIALVLILTLGLAYVWHALLPTLPISYPIIASLIIGLAIVPLIGSKIALNLGAPMMTRDERTRRYLSELGPLGLRGGGTPAYSTARRASGRSVRRG